LGFFLPVFLFLNPTFSYSDNCFSPRCWTFFVGAGFTPAFNTTMLAGQPQGIAPTRHGYNYIKGLSM